LEGYLDWEDESETKKKKLISAGLQCLSICMFPDEKREINWEEIQLGYPETMNELIQLFNAQKLAFLSYLFNFSNNVCEERKSKRITQLEITLKEFPSGQGRGRGNLMKKILRKPRIIRADMPTIDKKEKERQKKKGKGKRKGK